MQPIAPEEFAQRRERLRVLARKAGLSAVLINSESNHRYFTGHWSGRWTSRSRPIFLVISVEGDPVVSCSVVEQQTAEMSAQGCRVKVSRASGYDLEQPITDLAEVLRELGLDDAAIGVEFGVHHRPQIPPGGYEKLKERLPQLRYADASGLLWQLRMRKSSSEVARIRRAIEITDRMYATAPEWLSTMRTEREAYIHITRQMLEFGGDHTGYVNVLADTTTELAGGFTDRPFRNGRLIYIDAGCIVDGYWADHARIFCRGEPDAAAQAMYRKLWDVTEQMIEAVKPGVPLRSIYTLALDGIERATGTRPMLGRVGHSMGLDMPEPPSICKEEDLILDEGVVLNIEPSMRVPGLGTLIAEEVVVLTENGCELLTKRAPQAIPNVA